jgi:hypothetical protein
MAYPPLPKVLTIRFCGCGLVGRVCYLCGQPLEQGRQVAVYAGCLLCWPCLTMAVAQLAENLGTDALLRLR